jgi:hypothetical protein
MTPNQMICHLNDAFKGAIGEKAVSARSNFLTRTALKFLALQVPLKWAKGFKTRPEMDQQIGGTRPTAFEKDLMELKQLLNRLAQQEKDFEWQAHPIFGKMSEQDWLRWGYLHVDHHLRQFGA